MDTEEQKAGIKRVLVSVAALAVVGMIGGWGVARSGRPEPVAVASTETASVPGGTPGGVYVHVAGAVNAPGLYRLEREARVDDALRAAGGHRADADLDGLNLASKVRDGDKISVPVRGAAGAPDAAGVAAPPGSGKVNINTASPSELEQLPGVGPATAKKIIDYRTANGPFRTPKDLQKVSGIGPKRYEALAELITV